MSAPPPDAKPSDAALPALTVEPIGVVHSPHQQRSEAPNQPRAAAAVEGVIELLPHRNFEQALQDVESFRFLWVVYWFHHNTGWRPKVRPPRGDGKKGLFATRAPYRPNPIGLSAVELLSVDGRRLRVRGVDMLDGTPILDIKPYIPYTDAISEAATGWLDDAALEPDPLPRRVTTFSDLAQRQLGHLLSRQVDLEGPIRYALSLGIQRHAYRRMKPIGDHYELAVRAFRCEFRPDGDGMVVERLRSGYRQQELDRASPEDAELALHRAFIEAFPEAAPRS